MHGYETRQAQNTLLYITTFLLFSLILDNLWISLFCFLTAGVFVYYKLQIGQLYVQNIFIGCILYYLTKLFFEKQHIDFYIKVFLWFVFINIVYMCAQLFSLDFVFMQKTMWGFNENNDPTGFMGFKACLGMLLTFAVPLLYTRNNLTSRIASFALFIPIYLMQASVCVVGSGIALLWCIYHHSKKFFIALIIPLVMFSAFYISHDSKEFSFGNRFAQWKLVLHDASIHPISGWGLDSFRNVSETKKHVYAGNYRKENRADGVYYAYDQWDNPHNLYISLFFEFGILSLIILFGYLRNLVVLFRNSCRTNNAIGLFGVVIGLLVVSTGQFPMFLTKCVVFLIPLLALFEVETKKGDYEG